MQRSLPVADRIRIRIPLCALALMLLAPSRGFSQAFLLPDARYMTGRFAFHVDSGGHERLYVLDEGGDTLRSVSLVQAMPRVGTGSYFALVSREITGLEREVRVEDTNAPGWLVTRRPVGRFMIRHTQDVAVGLSSLVVRPRAEHRPGTTFDLRFRTLNGDTVAATQALSDFTLLTLEQVPHGYWVTVSVDSMQSHRVHAFTSGGQLLWDLALAVPRMPTVGISPSGRRAVVGVLEDDNRTSSLSVLDSLGVAISTRDVPGFRIALYSPDEDLLLLAGNGNLHLLDARVDSTATLWIRHDNYSLPAGKAVAFSSDSSRLHVLAQDRRFGSEPSRLWLHSYSNLLAAQPNVDSLQVNIPAEERIGVADLRELDDGRVRLVTGHGVSLLSP